MWPGPLQKDLGFTSVNPRLNGLKHRFVFGATSHEDTGPAQGGIAKLDRDSGALDEWLLGPSEWCGEPLFVAKPGNDAEDGGYLVTVVFDGQEQRSDVVVLDAAKVSQGPVARFALRPGGWHGGGAVEEPGAAWPERLLGAGDDVHAGGDEAQGDADEDVRQEVEGLP